MHSNSSLEMKLPTAELWSITIEIKSIILNICFTHLFFIMTFNLDKDFRGLMKVKDEIPKEIMVLVNNLVKIYRHQAVIDIQKNLKNLKPGEVVLLDKIFLDYYEPKPLDDYGCRIVKKVFKIIKDEMFVPYEGTFKEIATGK